MDRHERLFLAALQELFFHCPRVGAALLQEAGSARAIFEGERSRWRAHIGDRPELWERFDAFRAGLELTRAVRKLDDLGCELVALSDPRYPRLLRETYDPPPVLTAAGALLESLAEPIVAIVGARRAGRQALNLAAAMAEGLACRGYVVASGMAFGIDTAAHRGALRAGGPTIAVAGCGPDIIHPPSNRALACEIAREGLLLTEFPVGEPPFQSNFPQRNRVISGLALGVVVVEAAERSGSLITARFAAEQGREVMAVPGMGGTAMARGANALLRDGAALVEGADDVAAVLDPLRRTRGFPESPGQFKNDVAKDSPLLRTVPVRGAISADELVLSTGRRAEEILAELSQLSVAGLIEELPGRRWRRRSR